VSQHIAQTALDPAADDPSADDAGVAVAESDSAGTGTADRSAEAAADSAVSAADAASANQTGEALLVREGDIAADYLERLLDILDYDGDIDLDVEGERAVVAVVGSNLRGLIGPGGATLDAVQELTRLAVALQTGVRSRLMLDVGGYRAQRRTELTDVGRRAAEAVRDSGSKQKLAPMNPFERKVVHDAVAAVDGVFSESEGEEPARCVVVLPQA
jgi:spoIIIJ-associated protein